MPANPKLFEIPDPELLELIKDDPDYLSIVYKNTKDYCLRFMRSMLSNSHLREEELNDIYQDAVIILYEKILERNFRLTAGFQTYLNSVCRYQMLKRFRSEMRIVAFDPNDSGWANDMQFDPDVKDELRELDIEENNRFLAMEKALKFMKEAGGNCYEMLSLFWYHKRSIPQISEHFGYTNEANARNQKAKCQKRLRKMAYKELNVQ